MTGAAEKYRIVVVDNSSKDGSPRMVESLFSEVQLSVSPLNRGFGGGHNLAWRSGSEPYFLVLNPDILVEPGSIEALCRILDNDPDVAVAGPCLLNPDRSRQYSARRFYDWPTVLARRLPVPMADKLRDSHLMKDVYFAPGKPAEVDWLIGAALMCRRSAFAPDALLDERYGLYFEDVDLCYFAWKKGYKVVYLPDAFMIHDHQRLSAKSFFNTATVAHIKSWLAFRKKCRQLAFK